MVSGLIVDHSSITVAQASRQAFVQEGGRRGWCTTWDKKFARSSPPRTPSRPCSQLLYFCTRAQRSFGPAAALVLFAATEFWKLKRPLRPTARSSLASGRGCSAQLFATQDASHATQEPAGYAAHVGAVQRGVPVGCSSTSD